MKKTLRLTICFLLCLLGQAPVQAENSAPEKSTSWWQIWVQICDVCATAKKLFEQKTNSFFNNPITNTALIATKPISIIADGNQKNVEVQKYKQSIREREVTEAKKESAKLLAKLKPYCPDGKPELLAKRINEETAHQKTMELCKAEKERLAKNIYNLHKTIAQSQTVCRSPSKTALLVLGSLACGASAGALTYHLLRSLSSLDSCTKKIKQRQKQLKALSVNCKKLEKKVKAVRVALKRDALDDVNRTKAESFLEKNVPLLKEKRKEILSAKKTLVALQRKLVILKIGIPFISLVATVATTGTSLALLSKFSPEITPAQIPTTPEKIDDLKNRLTDADKKLKEESEKLKKLDQTRKAMPYISSSAKNSLMEWQQSKNVVKSALNLANQEDKEIGNAANIVLNGLYNQ